MRILRTLCGLLAVGAMAAGETDLLQLASDMRVRVAGGREIELQVRAGDEEGYEAIAARVAGGREQGAALAAWNANAPLRAGDWVRVPLSLLAPETRRLVLVQLFPQDRREGADWLHVVRAGRLQTYDEGLWQVAEWFTGRGENFSALLKENRLNSPELRAGQTIRVPGGLLHPAMRPAPRSEDGSLVYGSDEDGPYAGYDLKAGEALYSAVVVRFTGRTAAQDVIAISEQLRARSGIRDLTDIPVGYRVKIPLDLLEPQFLPEGHPRRRESEKAREALARELERRPVEGTRGGLGDVLVIIDPGHGGRDLGTMNNGIWEHDYVYDVACRLKRQLQEETAATVVMTLEDKQTGCVPSSTDKLTANHQGTVLTTPPFLAKVEGEARIGVNLRWYLANSVYRKALRDGTRSDRVVFLSLHADSRHASLSGVMVYTPGAAYRTRTYGSTSAVYGKYQEVREKPHVSYSSKERVRSEAVSRRFAETIVQAFVDEGLPVQPYQPVRNRIIRGQSKWVPAVLRGNAVPNKVLVEMVNLSHKGDAALLSKARDRERLARGLQRALFLYFGEQPPSRRGRS